MELYVDCFYLAQDRTQWKIFVTSSDFDKGRGYRD
jgi:hypothetical protein